ncbi:MAG: DHH family phosphoesterase [Nanoarchaeota archaeon]|nr:DHH family phosphoesterase [Nanoarchaeota archaeon]
MNEEIRKQAENFINNINESDKVAIITDHDPDGFTSGTLFFDYCLKKGAKVTQFTYSRGSSIEDDFNLENFNKIITTDLSSAAVAPILKKYEKKEILFMDHHPSDAKLPEGVIEYRTMYRGYIPSARSAYELCGGKKWLSLVGIIIDAGFLYKENDEFIKGALDEVNMTRKEFQDSVAFPISNAITYLNKEPEKAFPLVQNISNYDNLEDIKKYSKPIEDEANRLVKEFEQKKEDLGGVIFFYLEPKYSVKGIIVNKISLKEESLDKIFIFASPNDSGKITFSARSQSKKINMATLLQEGIKGIDGNVGGHFNASGGIIPKEDLNKFKENLRRFLKKNPLN